MGEKLYSLPIDMGVVRATRYEARRRGITLSQMMEIAMQRALEEKSKHPRSPTLKQRPRLQRVFR
jgi:hypothetical protein